MFKYSMPVSKKVTINGKPQYEEVGKVAVTVPLLADILPFINSAQAVNEDGTPKLTGDKLPVYESKEANWIQGAIFAAVKAGARNKLISNTADVKPGLTIPSNWAEFTAESDGNKGDALAVIREAKASFTAWLATQGKSDKVVSALTTLFGSKPALKLQPAANRAKFAEIVMSYAESLDEAQQTRFERHIAGLIEAASEEDEADDWAS